MQYGSNTASLSVRLLSRVSFHRRDQLPPGSKRTKLDSSPETLFTRTSDWRGHSNAKVASESADPSEGTMPHRKSLKSMSYERDPGGREKRILRRGEETWARKWRQINALIRKLKEKETQNQPGLVLSFNNSRTYIYLQGSSEGAWPV